MIWAMWVARNFSHPLSPTCPWNENIRNMHPECWVFLWQPSNATPSLDFHNNSTSDEDVEMATTTMASSEAEGTLRTLKLEDYDEIAFDPTQSSDRVRRETIQNVHHTLRADAKDDAIEEQESTTIEVTTSAMTTTQAQDSSENNFVTAITPQATPLSFYYMPNYNKLPYPPSKYPSAQHISIAHPPSPLSHQNYYLPIKNHYDFHPSRPDYNHNNYFPYCNIQNSFVPTSHKAWNYNNWKWIICLL